MTGITLGCACSCKNTAWGLTVFDAFCYILQFSDNISIQNFRLKKIKKNNRKKRSTKPIEKCDNTKSELSSFISSSNKISSPLKDDDQQLNTTVLSNRKKIDQKPKIENDTSSASFIDLNNGSLIQRENNTAVDHLLKTSKEELKTKSEVNLSISPLDIQSSIQSSIIDVVDGFQEEFNEHEFIQKVGTGGGYFDFFFDVGTFGFTLALIGLSVYCITFYVHFILLPFAGKGTGFLQPDMKKQLISNKCATCKKPNVTHKSQQVMMANYNEEYDECINSALYGSRLKGPSLFERTFILTFRMHSGNMRIVGFHDSQSFPYNWPILSGVSTYFWGMNGREIRCIGNAIVYYLVLFSLIIVTLYVIIRSFILFVNFYHKSKDNKNISLHSSKNVSVFKKLISKFFVFLESIESKSDFDDFVPYCNQKWLIALRFVVGYSVSYFPFYWIPRTLYLYHYLIPLIFGCLTFGSMVELFLPVKYRSVFVVFVCIASGFGFWLWSPYVYGTDKHDQDMMIWTRRWIDGDERHKKDKIENNLKKKK